MNSRRMDQRLEIMVEREPEKESGDRPKDQEFSTVLVETK